MCKKLHLKFNSDKKYTVVHYRRGDSVWADSIYYEKVRELIRNENENVYIATDSLDEAKKFFSECDNVRFTNSK